MCIAIGPLYRVKKGVLATLWWRIAGVPSRLFNLGALLQLILLIALLLLADAGIPAGIISAIILGMAGLVLFGALMDRFPLWSGRSPVNYMLYVSTFFLISAGLLSTELALFLGDPWHMAGMVMLLLGWVVGLWNLLDYRPWIPRLNRTQGSLGLVAVIGSGLGLALSLLTL
jgi:hypothetical protein